MASEEKNGKINKKQNKKRRKFPNSLKPGWVAPEGGWGWVIVVASGMSNVFIVALNVSFGLIFRKRFEQFGISTSQTTTIINFNAAVGSFMGLINGPLFRKYTFRQAGCVAGIICSAAICTMAFIKTFYGMLLFYSIIFASGKSILLSTSALSVIPYFKKKRRIAVGISWAFSGLGNMASPQTATLLMSIYGAFGTIILFGGIALHTVVCAVLMQPVQMNAKRSPEYEKIKTVAKEHDENASEAEINGCGDKIEKRLSQHSHKNEKENELETLLMTHTQDDRVMRLNTSHEIMESNLSQPDSIVLQRTSSMTELNSEISIQNLNRQSRDINDERQRVMDMNENTQDEITKIDENTDDIESHENNSCRILHDNHEKIEYLMEKGSTMTCQEVLERKQKKLSWWTLTFRAVVAFFDLDLLRDFVCVNIMIGVSLVFITEINFLILTPYILADYGLTDSQTAIVMSTAGGIDVLTRIIISIVANRIGWENSTFLFIGVGLSALGHGALAHANTYSMILGIAIISSMGKAISFVFSALVLPDYVSLEKLPAATGLQLMTRGILYLMIGPVIGRIRETSGSYTLPLHFLNLFSYYIVISGIIQRWCVSSKRTKSEQ